MVKRYLFFCVLSVATSVVLFGAGADRNKVARAVVIGAGPCADDISVLVAAGGTRTVAASKCGQKRAPVLPLKRTTSSSNSGRGLLLSHAVESALANPAGYSTRCRGNKRSFSSTNEADLAACTVEQSSRAVGTNKDDTASTPGSNDISCQVDESELLGSSISAASIDNSAASIGKIFSAQELVTNLYCNLQSPEIIFSLLTESPDLSARFTTLVDKILSRQEKSVAQVTGVRADGDQEIWSVERLSTLQRLLVKRKCDDNDELKASEGDPRVHSIIKLLTASRSPSPVVFVDSSALTEDSATQYPAPSASSSSLKPSRNFFNLGFLFSASAPEQEQSGTKDQQTGQYDASNDTLTTTENETADDDIAFSSSSAASVQESNPYRTYLSVFMSGEEARKLQTAYAQGADPSVTEPSSSSSSSIPSTTIASSDASASRGAEQQANQPEQQSDAARQLDRQSLDGAAQTVSAAARAEDQEAATVTTQPANSEQSAQPALASREWDRWDYFSFGLGRLLR